MNIKLLQEKFSKIKEKLDSAVKGGNFAEIIKDYQGRHKEGDSMITVTTSNCTGHVHVSLDDKGKALIHLFTLEHKILGFMCQVVSELCSGVGVEAVLEMLALKTIHSIFPASPLIGSLLNRQCYLRLFNAMLSKMRDELTRLATKNQQKKESEDSKRIDSFIKTALMNATAVNKEVAPSD